MNQSQHFNKIVKRRLTSNNLSLPNTYQQVEYLQSSGTQYIPTGLYGADGLYVTFQTVTFESEAGIVAAREGNTIYNRFGIVQWNGSGNKLYFMTNGYNGTYVEDYQKHTVSFGSNTGWDVIMDGSVFETIPSDQRSTTDKEMYLFRDNAMQGNGKCKIFEAKFYISGTLERDFIPCYRKSDDKPGMYDLVSKTFFTNSGTGEFSIDVDS